MAWIQLTYPEIVIASTVGGMRFAESVASGRKDSHGVREDEDGLCYHINGAAGEMALAKMLNRYWGGNLNTFKAADIGQNLQVRTRSRPDYDLIVRPDDEDHYYYALVRGQVPRLEVVGYLLGADAKKDEFLREHGGRPPAWFVPADRLRSFFKPRAADHSG